MPRAVEALIDGVWAVFEIHPTPKDLAGYKAHRTTARYVGGVLEVYVGNGYLPAWGVVHPSEQQYTPDEAQDETFRKVGVARKYRLNPYPDQDPGSIDYRGIKAIQISGSVKADPTPEWRQSLALSTAPGECPCGIRRAACEYHASTSLPVASESRNSTMGPLPT